VTDFKDLSNGDILASEFAEECHMGWKKFILAAAVIGWAEFAYTALGSSPAGRDGAHQEMMGGSVNADGHMTSPLHRQMVGVFVLPEMQSELGLSVQQTADLRRLKNDLLAKSKDVAAQIAVRRRELDTLLSGDTSRTRTVKALFDKIAELHAQLQYAGFDASVKMKALLDDAQKVKFNAMKPADLHRVMMSSGNMADMGLAMQMMGAQEDMGMGRIEMHSETTRDAMPPDSHGMPGMHHGSTSAPPPQVPAH
jgi:hypothetical protein